MVLPEPDGPTTARNSRSATSSDTRSSTLRPPPYDLETSWNEIAAGCRSLIVLRWLAPRHSTVTPLALIGPLQRAISPATNLREIFRGAALGRGDFFAERLRSARAPRQVQRLAERRAELVDDRLRRVLGEEQALPGQHVEIEALLLARSGCCGSAGERFMPVIAIALTCLPSICGFEVEGVVADVVARGPRSGPASRAQSPR